MKEKQELRNDFGIGMHQACKYWAFLFFAKEDVEQEIRLALYTHPPQKGLKEFNLALNRGLYKLARSLGFRKRHVNEGPNQKGQWFDRIDICR